MVITEQRVVCRHCGSADVVCNGRTRNGKQRFLCYACGRSFRENAQTKGYSDQEKERILRAYEERSSLRGLQRTFGVARHTVSSWLKKTLNCLKPSAKVCALTPRLWIVVLDACQEYRLSCFMFQW